MTTRFFCIGVWMLVPWMALAQAKPRPRIRDLGVKIGVLQPGRLNAITDVAGVEVGQTTLIRGDKVRTGVTAILPHGGNLFQEKVPGAVLVGNAFGKLIGSTQVNELGEIETPILLTSTLSVGRVADALISYVLQQPGNEDVESVNPLVGETNDGYLNDIRSRPVTEKDVFAAIANAKDGPVRKGTWAPGPARWRSHSRAELELHRGNCLHRLAATRWEFWCRQILAGC